MNNLFRTHDFPHRSKYHHDHDFNRTPLINFDRNPFQNSQFLSTNNNQFSINNTNILPNLFQQININPDDGDDEDDDDDDDKPTPTIDHPSPRFPK
jgi:hypothetical protein